MRKLALATATVAASGAQTVALLRRMRTELTDAGRLSPPTVAWMYGTYGAHAAVTGAALNRRSGHVPLPRAVSVVGGVSALAGTGLAAAGMARFGSPRQLSGTEAGPLIDSGVYRYSRNPQYTGFVAGMAGLALARRSGLACAFVAGMAAAYRWWIAVEEQHLERVFGDAYRTYRDRTPRWLGLPVAREASQTSRSGSSRVMAPAAVGPY